MAKHHVMIGGTSYAVGGGTALVNGTKYQIGGGTTLIDGTGYQINFAEPAALKWLLNETVTFPTKTLYGTFTAGKGDLLFGSINAQAKSLTYITTSGQGLFVATKLGSGKVRWGDNGYRTLTFTEPPTGDMLAWLQENGTPQ